jgi:RNA polymerase sigma-70 factor (ECF subfamily)
MERVGAGDHPAFAELVIRHQDKAWALAWRMLGDAAEAQDAVQETFLRILRSASRYRPDASFRTYLFHVLTHVCLDMRAKKHPDYGAELSQVASGAMSPEQRALQRETSFEVHRALAKLPARQRAALLLRHFDGLSYQEIAAVLGVSAKAVDSILQRGRDSLRKLLQNLF